MENVVRRIVPEQSQFPAMQSFIPYARLTAILNDAFPYSRRHFSAIPLRTSSRAPPKISRAEVHVYNFNGNPNLEVRASFSLSILPCTKITRELIITLRDIPATCNFATSLVPEFNANHFLATLAKFAVERFTAKVILFQEIYNRIRFVYIIIPCFL